VLSAYPTFRIQAWIVDAGSYVIMLPLCTFPFDLAGALSHG